MPIYMGNGSSIVGGANLFTLKNSSGTTVYETGVGTYGGNTYGYFNNTAVPGFIAGKTSAGSWINYSAGYNKVCEYCDATVYNRGSHYSTANTRFNVPYTGPYLFIFTAYGYCGDGNIDPLFYVNGSASTRRNSIPYRIRTYGWLNPAYTDIQMEEVINCVAGDYVEAYTYFGNLGGSLYHHYSCFMGVYVG